jgi:hypothetical protein
MRKLRREDLEARIVRATVEPSRRAEVLKEATSRVNAKARIDFRRDVRKS